MNVATPARKAAAGARDASLRRAILGSTDIRGRIERGHVIARKAVDAIAETVDLSLNAIASLIGTSPRTIKRRIAKNDRLTPSEGESGRSRARRRSRRRNDRRFDSSHALATYRFVLSRESHAVRNAWHGNSNAAGRGVALRDRIRRAKFLIRKGQNSVPSRNDLPANGWPSYFSAAGNEQIGNTSHETVPPKMTGPVTWK